jgi:transposase-like protein
VFLVGRATPLYEACRRHGLDLRYERHGNRNSVERILRDIRRRNTRF